MNAMTCAQVQDQLDLLAAGECEPSTRTEVESHLNGCLACSAKYRESQRLIGLLNIHCNDRAIERLLVRTSEISKKSEITQPRKPWILRKSSWFAMAALVLLAIGLVWWLPNRNDQPIPQETQIALLVQPHERAKPDVAPGPLKEKFGEQLTMKAFAMRSKDELVRDKMEGKLPVPQAISLDLVLVNTGSSAAELRLGDAKPVLELDVQGKKVDRIEAPGAETPAFLQPRTITLAPNERQSLHIDRLIAGSPGKLEYIYFTQKGEYTLTARIHLRAAGKELTVSGPAVRIKVDE
jgi:hypothetical protein